MLADAALAGDDGMPAGDERHRRLIAASQLLSSRDERLAAGRRFYYGRISTSMPLLPTIYYEADAAFSSA